MDTVEQNSPELEAHQYRLWCHLLERRTGIRVGDERREQVSARIRQRMASRSIEDADEYFRLVSDEPAGLSEWHQLVDLLVARETEFFRHRDSIDYVSQLWREHQLNGGGSFTVWSLGCASGEEAYSLTLALEQAHQSSASSYGVYGMDVSRAAITAARTGEYSSAQLRGVKASQLARFFVKSGDGNYRAGDTLRRRTCFIRGNVLAATSIAQMQNANIIFCQNLLPYFRRWQRQQLVTRLASSLDPGGRLIIGPGELADWRPPALERDGGKTVQVYRRPGEES